MKALVLSGGAGTRLRPLTYTGAKQLVPVANRPVLFYVMDNLIRAGITEIGVVVSPETGREVERALLGGGFPAQFTFIRQDEPRGLAHAVLIAESFLSGHPFVMYLGDNLISADLAPALTKFQTDTSITASIFLKEVERPEQFGVAMVDANGNVTGLEEKPKEPKSRLALVGIYLFRPTVFDVIRAQKPSARGELEITDALGNILASGGKLDTTRVEGWWLDTGKKDDLLLANDTVLDDWLEPAQLGNVDTHSELVGRVRIEAGAVVERSSIRGPAIIGAGARVIDSRIGPFTSIGPRVTVERSRLEHSVLMEGAHIADIPHLEDSLIGKRVIVRPSKKHTGLSLMVGDDCIVEFGTGG